MLSTIRLRSRCVPNSASRSQLDKSLAAGEWNYWRESSLPCVAILFLLPLIAAYELAASSVPADFRNPADVWMRDGLFAIGLRHPLSLPAMLLAGLAIWQWLGRHPLRCRATTCLGIVAESLAVAAVLIIVGQAVCLSTSSGAAHSVWGATASFVGTGVYEEVLFRLLLLPATFGLLRLCRVPVKTSWGLAIAANAILFATAHYLTPGTDAFTLSGLNDAVSGVANDPSQWFGWLFRCAAGVAFCVLFIHRGLAVAVGSHVCYDLLVGVVIEQMLTSRMA